MAGLEYGKTQCGMILLHDREKVCHWANEGGGEGGGDSETIKDVLDNLSIYK